MKFIKPGKVVVVLQGRFAGKKAVVLRNYDDGSKDKPYAHALIAGVEKYPLKITKRMSKKKKALRSRIKPFVKLINFNHFMPTRYTLELDSGKTPINEKTIQDPTARKEAKSYLRQEFQSRFKAGKNPWFFSKLRF